MELLIVVALLSGLITCVAMLLFKTDDSGFIRVPLIYDENGDYDWEQMNDYYHAELDVIQMKRGEL